MWSNKYLSLTTSVVSFNTHKGDLKKKAEEVVCDI